MQVKQALLFVVVLTLVAQHVQAEFLYNRVLPKAEELDALDMKCIPGRTVIRIKEKFDSYHDGDSSDYEDDARRTHMTHQTNDESCQVCVCSVEGKDEYCSVRPASNVNECIRMTMLMDRFKSNAPFEHERSLSFRMRRDYIWHKDEIPYNPKASCKRGYSYYSSSINANDTDIDVDSDIESLLDYTNTDACSFCVCNVDGLSTSCLTRNPWYCNYYRNLRGGGGIRDMYRQLFQEDRPTYFRQISYRLRRTMDNGMFDLMDNVGSGNGLNDKKCAPFISEYTDCSEANMCAGCSKCTCNGDGQWSCEKIRLCPGDDDESLDDANIKDEDIDNALVNLQNAFKNRELKEISLSRNPFVPKPPKHIENFVLEEKSNIEDEIMALMRQKRSIHEKNNIEAKNRSNIKFYDTVDEINEDSLKNKNVTGTLQANKVDAMSHVFRRTGVLNNNSAINDLQIEYTQSQIYNNHITDNKIDTTAHNEDKFDLLDHEKIHNVMGNHTQQVRDHDISKLVVNELKNGTEIIGDIRAPVISNITFTPENDTLTAMAFIAGNLLNKLWNMEKETSDLSIETEVLKHEKIADLLDLFKEPLNLRQETFLKNALEQLSNAINKSKDIRNISLCEKVEEVKKILVDTNISNGDEKEAKERSGLEKCRNKNNKEEKETKKTATEEAITKINNVLDLIKKYEHVQNNLKVLKHKPKSNLKEVRLKSSKSYVDTTLTEEEKSSINLFGNIFETLTKLLLPDKNGKKLINSMRNKNIFETGQNLRTKFKKMYNIDLNNLTVTSKDKIVFDYLRHIENSPDCLLNEKSEKLYVNALPNVEGNILLNLSEFFKMKSFVDLMKLVQPENKPNVRTSMKSIEIATETSTTIDVKEPIINNDNPKTLETTKEKLKAHLKDILEDLIELEKANGRLANETNIRIADALPCLYRLLNADKQIKNKSNENLDHDPLNKVAEIFDSLKKDLKLSTLTRRTNAVGGQRPKSAIVWERVIKNLNGKQKKSTRRNMNIKMSKPIDDLKKTMEIVASSVSKSYKVKALQSPVPPADRLLLLKALEMDAIKYINTLENMKLSLETITKLPLEKHKDLSDFVDNAASNIILGEKVLKSLEKSNTGKGFIDQFDSRKESKHNFKLEEFSKLQAAPALDNLKLTRDQIINHIIKNRVQQYKRIKEAKQINLDNDIQYNIAKSILLYLERGNYSLARELYKVFSSQKQNTLANERPYNNESNKHPTVLENKEPLLQFYDPQLVDNRMQWTSTDQLVKQLLNINKMRVQ